MKKVGANGDESKSDISALRASGQVLNCCSKSPRIERQIVLAQPRLALFRLFWKNPVDIQKHL